MAKGRLRIEELTESVSTPQPVAGSSKGINGEDFASIDEVRRWLADPLHWFVDGLWIVRWDGTVPRVAARHGRAIFEKKGSSLPEFVFAEQKKIRMGVREQEPEIVE